MSNYEHVVGFALDHPWAITKPMLKTIAAIFASHIAGIKPSTSDIEAATAARRDLPQPKRGAVGILPVYGVIAPRTNMMSEMSGGTSLDKLSAQLHALLNDESVATILMDVDSPGGNVAGVNEFHGELLAARQRKPIVAVAHYTMASAAYWLASAATEIVATRSARIGAIGVFTIHDDLSKALEMNGIKRTYIAAGKHKVDGNETEPLSPEVEARIKATIDEVYNLMTEDIAKGRGIDAAVVRAGYGEGDVVSAPQALALKMVDRIATVSDVLQQLTGASADGRSSGGSMMRGEEVQEQISAETVPAEPSEPADTCEPDAEGNCPKGYSMGDDGVCHLAPTEMDDATRAARQARADADLTMTTLAVIETLPR